MQAVVRKRELCNQ